MIFMAEEDPTKEFKKWFTRPILVERKKEEEKKPA